MEDWLKGPRRATRWKHGLPFPNHRSLAEVDEDRRKRDQQRAALIRERLREREAKNGPRATDV